MKGDICPITPIKPLEDLQTDSFQMTIIEQEIASPWHDNCLHLALSQHWTLSQYALLSKAQVYAVHSVRRWLAIFKKLSEYKTTYEHEHILRRSTSILSFKVFQFYFLPIYTLQTKGLVTPFSILKIFTLKWDIFLRKR